MALPSRDECASKVPKRSWSSLPQELLSLIADRLGLVELLSFRGVCKDWRASSTAASAEIECAPGAEPYFLLHTGDGKCILYDQKQNKNYRFDIPGLREATFLASSQGWLLLFQEGSPFFFCPFSSARIDLPKFPHPEISDHLAAFSAPPTSPDCTVTIINRCGINKLQLNVLCRGADTWTTYELSRQGERFGPVTGAIYTDDGTFHYVDDRKRAATFSLKQKSWQRCVIVETGDVEILPFGYRDKYSSRSDLRKCLGLDMDVSISACGAVLTSRDLLICKENLKGTEESGRRELKGVWIQPRVYHIPPNQSW